MLVNEQESDAEYCVELAIKHDRERLLCAMLSPSRHAGALAALLAWNHEIAKVGDIVSDPMVGLIRFQWWRDALDEIYGDKPVREHAVALELAKAIRQYQLPREGFESILAAREADLEAAPFPNLASLDAYVEETAGGIARLWLHVLGVRSDVGEAAAVHIASAWALVGTVRSIHFQAHQGRVRLPGVDAQKLIQHGFDASVAAAVEAVCGVAEEHIVLARRMKAPEEALSAMLPALLAEDYLKRIASAGYNPFDPKVESGRAKRAFLLWWGKIRKRY